MNNFQFARFVILITLAVVCTACLITNCPKGGKRSLAHGTESLRQCPRCGPAKLGHCFGPTICCGHEIGCLINTPDTLVCLKEHLSPDPCVGPTAANCGNRKGKCAADRVCCTPESCEIDASCRFGSPQHFRNVGIYPQYVEGDEDSLINEIEI